MYSKPTDPCKIACDGRRKSEPFSFNSFLKNSAFLVRLGALSGVVALGLNAYVKKDGIFADEFKDPKYNKLSPQLQNAFDVANTQHVYNSLALMATPLFSKSPVLTGGLLVTGITLFCGSQYFKVFKNREDGYRGAAALGGLCLVGGWASFLL